MSSSPVTVRLAGVFALIIVAALDQWSKTEVLQAAHLSEIPRDIFPFFTLVLVHNHGISFGLFAGGQVWGAHLLTFITSAVAVALAFWLASVREFPVSLALGCIIGGAAGNIYDRVRFGAVTDFLDFHLGGYHWPAFNVADSSIFIGVVILVLISIVSPAKEKESPK